MTRTGTLAFSRLALLATLVGSAGVALGQSSRNPLLKPIPAGKLKRTSDHQPSYRRADSSAAELAAHTQPIHAARKPRPSHSRAAEELADTHASPPAGRKPCAKSTPNSTAKQTAVRAPKPFVPPTDAKQLVAAQRPPRPTIEADAPIVAQSRPNANVATSAAQSSRSVAQPAPAPARTRGSHRARQQDRVAYRPKPTPTKGTRLFDDSWIRPLKQVAYQAGEPEELYAPPGQPESKCRCRRRCWATTMGPEMQSDGEWIGSPEAAALAATAAVDRIANAARCAATASAAGSNCEPRYARSVHRGPARR